MKNQPSTTGFIAGIQDPRQDFAPSDASPPGSLLQRIQREQQARSRAEAHHGQHPRRTLRRRTSHEAEETPGEHFNPQPAPQPAPHPGPYTGPRSRQQTDERSGDYLDAAYMPLSRTTECVLRMLLEGDLGRLRAESVAESLGISCTTLRRRLRNDHTNYQFLLDRARQYRCEARLRERWLPGKCLADELGYLEVNSFYRAFRRWTGISYSAYRAQREGVQRLPRALQA
ncbi:MAG: AraC family transcriptional regulator [Halieaceae bacterium]|jgi:AraC-like DNA-binding protein|nr:AraC family transcriptional regulator [Halieaceae bacterium]